MTSAENSISEPPNLKIFWGRIPPAPPYKACDNASPLPTHYKNLAMAVSTKAETWSFHFILHPFENKDVHLHTNPVSHKGFIHNLSSCKNIIKIITNLMDENY